METDLALSLSLSSSPARMHLHDCLLTVTDRHHMTIFIKHLKFLEDKKQNKSGVHDNMWNSPEISKTSVTGGDMM